MFISEYLTALNTFDDGPPMRAFIAKTSGWLSIGVIVIASNFHGTSAIGADSMQTMVEWAGLVGSDKRDDYINQLLTSKDPPTRLAGQLLALNDAITENRAAGTKQLDVWFPNDDLVESLDSYSARAIALLRSQVGEYQRALTIIDHLGGQNIANRNGFTATAMLALAKRIHDNAVTDEDLVYYNVEILFHISDEQIAEGLANPVLLYWQYFDKWPILIQKLSDLKLFLARPTVSAYVFAYIPNDALLNLINSADFTSVFTPKIQGSFIQEAAQKKLIDLSTPEWQAVLDKLYQDPTGKGAYVYFIFAADRGETFQTRLADYIVKYQNNAEIIAITALVTSQDLKHMDIMSLPVSDKLKAQLLQTANPHK